MKFLIWNVIIEINFFKNITFWSFDMPVFDFSLWKKSNLTNSRVYIGYQKRSRDLQKGINRSKFPGVVGGTGGQPFPFSLRIPLQTSIENKKQKMKNKEKTQKTEENQYYFLSHRGQTCFWHKSLTVALILINDKSKKVK